MFVCEDSNGESGYVAFEVIWLQVVFGGRVCKISNEF